MRRNASKARGYQPSYANQQARARRETGLAAVLPERFTQLVQTYNNTPRRRLGYRSPAEIIDSEVLHLKCESAFPRKRE